MTVEGIVTDHIQIERRGAVQVIRYRRKAIAHLQRMHPGVVEQMKRGEAVAHLGFHEREGV